jgi:tetratricopeptide (TPR) repeat protein
VCVRLYEKYNEKYILKKNDNVSNYNSNRVYNDAEQLVGYNSVVMWDNYSQLNFFKKMTNILNATKKFKNSLLKSSELINHPDFFINYIQQLENNNVDSFLVLPMQANFHTFGAIIKKQFNKIIIEFIDKCNTNPLTNTTDIIHYEYSKSNIDKFYKIWLEGDFQTTKKLIESVRLHSDKVILKPLKTINQKDANCFLKELETAVKYQYFLSKNTSVINPLTAKWPSTLKIHELYFKELIKENPNLYIPLQMLFKIYKCNKLFRKNINKLPSLKDFNKNLELSFMDLTNFIKDNNLPYMKTTNYLDKNSVSILKKVYNKDFDKNISEFAFYKNAKNEHDSILKTAITVSEKDSKPLTNNLLKQYTIKFEEANRQYNNSPYILFNLGMNLLQEKNPKALEVLKTAVKLSPNFGFGNYLMGQAYFQNGNLLLAKEYFLKAQELNKKFNYSQHFKKELKVIEQELNRKENTKMSIIKNFFKGFHKYFLLAFGFNLALAGLLVPGVNIAGVIAGTSLIGISIVLFTKEDGKIVANTNSQNLSNKLVKYSEQQNTKRTPITKSLSKTKNRTKDSAERSIGINCTKFRQFHQKRNVDSSHITVKGI